MVAYLWYWQQRTDVWDGMQLSEYFSMMWWHDSLLLVFECILRDTLTSFPLFVQGV